MELVAITLNACDCSGLAYNVFNMARSEIHDLLAHIDLVAFRARATTAIG